MMPTLTISLAQMDVKAGNPRVNWETVQEQTAEAARRGSDLVIFPELWDNGYALDKAKEVSSQLNGGLFAQVASLSHSSNIHTVGSLLPKRGLGVFKNTGPFLPARGVFCGY